MQLLKRVWLPLVIVVVGAVFVGSRLWHNMFGSSEDFAGDGVDDVVIEVHTGDTTTAIGQTLQQQNVVSSSKVFVAAAATNLHQRRDQPQFLLGKRGAADGARRRGGHWRA